MPDKILVARTSAVIRIDGRRRVITRNKTLVQADDPIVKGRESLFRVVETATAAPGELRSTTRPRPAKKAAPAAQAKPDDASARQPKNDDE